MLVNNSRNLAMKLAAILPENDSHRAFFRKIIPAYDSAVKNHLPSEDPPIEMFDDLTPEMQEKLDLEKHIPNQVAALMYRQIEELRQTNLLTDQQVLYLNPELQSFTDICGGCERIRNTPIPYSYSVFIKKFVTVYILTLPFGFVFTLGYYVIPMVGLVFYFLTSLELIAEEIEEPFGGDEDDLPLGRISRSISSHIDELI